MTLLRSLSVVGLGALLLWLGADKIDHSRRDKEVMQQFAELQEAHRQLGTLVQSLRTEQSQFERAAGMGAHPVPTAVPTAAPPAAVPPPAAPPPARPEPRNKPPTLAELQVGFENAFYGEAEDMDWSPRAQKLVQASMERLLAEGSRLASVRCGSSMCRIETIHRSREHYEQLLAHSMSAQQPGPWNGAFFSMLNESGGTDPLTAVSFLAREGKSFPTISGR